MTPRDRAMTARKRPGFTLTELVAVMVILGALSITAAPAVRSMTSAREGAMSRQLERQLELARAFATASGQPTGLIYDSGESVFRLRRIATDGGAPTPVPSPLGATYDDLLLAVAYPSVAVTGFTTGDGDPSHQAVWFGFDGTPEVRDDAGVLISGFTQDAVITTTGVHTVTIRMSTGAIEG